MESNNLGSKKKNNKQNISDEFSPKNVSDNKDSSATKLVSEVETKSNGDQKIVHRARNVETHLDQENSENNENPSSSIALFTDKETQRMIENKDLNSDITAHRYPNSDPNNHEDRGNIKLDE